jgi:flagellar protein FliO/FliZ
MRQQGQLRVISQLSIGARERIVILEVQERWIVVGVTPGGMSRLGTFPKGIAAESDTGNPMVQMPSFAALIDRMRGNAS